VRPAATAYVGCRTRCAGLVLPVLPMRQWACCHETVGFMAWKPIVVAVLATVLVGCGYEPAPDRPSDPLSRPEGEKVWQAIDELQLLCETADVLEPEPWEYRRFVTNLKHVAKKRPHGVYRAAKKGEFFDQHPVQRGHDGPGFGAWGSSVGQMPRGPVGELARGGEATAVPQLTGATSAPALLAR
jgi:hypothetical protein